MSDTTNDSTWPWTFTVTWSDGSRIAANDNEVAAIIGLLEAADDAEWGTVPDVREYWADAQSERGPGVADCRSRCLGLGRTDVRGQ